MLRHIWFIMRKDLHYVMRSRETIMWVFIMPGIFMFFIGTVTGNMSGSGRGQDIIALWSGDNTGFLDQELETRLGESDYQVVRMDSLAQFAPYTRRLMVPDNFTDTILNGEQTTLQLNRKRTGMDGDYDTFRVSRASYTLLADLIVVNSQGKAPSPESFQEIRDTPRALTLDVSSAGNRKKPPSGYEQAIPGLIVMFTLMIMTTTGAVTLVVERRQGLLRRLAYTPITRPAVVWGKWAGKLTLGIIQVTAAMIIGTLLFKMQWGSNVWMVALILIANAGAMASVAMLLGTVARSEGIAIGFGVASSNVLAALGGCWWPIEVTPEWMQKLQLFLPTGWAMDAMHRLISFADSPVAVLPHLAAMVITAVVLLAVSSRTFRYQ